MPKTNESFESLVTTIDALVAKLEDPKTGIEASLEHYEEAMKLLSKAQRRLDDIQHSFDRIRVTQPPKEADANIDDNTLF